MDFAQKQQAASTLRDELETPSALVLVSFSGLSVEDANDLRNKFREAGCVYRVYKNSTIRFAVEDTPHADMKSLLVGMSGLAYHPEDPGAAARVARDYCKANKALQIKGGVLDGDLMDEAGVRRLADLPGPQELKAMLLSLFNAPATQMVRVLSAAPQSFLNLLNAKKDKDAA